MHALRRTPQTYSRLSELLVAWGGFCGFVFIRFRTQRFHPFTGLCHSTRGCLDALSVPSFACTSDHGTAKSTSSISHERLEESASSWFVWTLAQGLRFGSVALQRGYTYTVHSSAAGSGAEEVYSQKQVSALIGYSIQCVTRQGSAGFVTASGMNSFVTTPFSLTGKNATD